MNAIFCLKVSIVVSHQHIIGVAHGTAMCLAALPLPMPVKIQLNMNPKEKSREIINNIAKLSEFYIK
jgi:hypothetical protein